ncbi:DEAD domain-containing protein [Rhizoctonia solani AG-1 IA]|uniref:DEAD domain-containing protein n=1 Tax=Thanatephorus cucumeris (strain AG1-IA) TaxID=983506 RepID=L8WZI7_THACA|nr:DEAD domain-containing protein [Rhizoctonia solani AG-1 IA]
MPPKRKRNSGATTDSGPSKPPNQRTSDPAPKAQSKGKVVAKKSEESNWPTFFQDVCSSPGLTLAIAWCARALLPDIICFAYYNANELKVNADTAGKDGTPDIYAPQNFSGDSSEEEHVLVLDFAESRKVKGSQRGSQGSGLILPVALTPAGVKNLIEKRNDRFCAAVNECVYKRSLSRVDPVALVTSAAHDHIPINPASILESTISGSSEALTIPSSSERPSMESVIKSFKDFHEARPYRDQIVYERVFDKREARWGELARPISNNVANALKMARGVTGFYSHQAAAINSIWDEKNVIVSTSTASGKSVIYQALAQDQKGAIEQLLLRCPGLEDIKVGICAEYGSQPLQFLCLGCNL